MNILFLCNNDYYNRKMSRVRFHYIDSLLSNKINVKYWGINWNGYNNELTLQDNLNSINVCFDFIICYKPLEHKGVKDVNIPKIIIYNEMEPWERTLNELQQSNCSIAICHHVNEMRKFKYICPQVRYFYIPHCSDQRFFKDYNLPKIYDVAVIGRLSSDAYPLRTRLSLIVPSLSSKWKTIIHTHPGYDIDKAYDDHVTIEYAKFLNQCKIVAFCSGKDRTRFSKYTEACACGAMVVSDLPDDDNIDEMKKFMAVIESSMTDKEILNKIKYYLEHDNERMTLINYGKEYANKYTTQYYSTELKKILKANRNANILTNTSS